MASPVASSAHRDDTNVRRESEMRGVLVARDVMSTELLTVAADDGMLLTWELITQAGVHHVPVLDANRCIGLVDAVTLAMECVRDPLGHHRRLVREVLPPSTPRVSDDTPVEDVAHHMLATGPPRWW